MAVYRLHPQVAGHAPGRGCLQAVGDAYATLVQGVLVLLVLWLILFWMYRRKLFLKI